MNESEHKFNEYTLVRRLGAGGMAEVFLAKKSGVAGFARYVAVKTILADNTPMDSIQLFLDEARVASHLRHSGIVQTLDLGIENETLFIAMEYIDGPTLSRLIYDLKKMGGLLPWPIVAYIGAKVANALDYAHRRATDNEGQLLSLVHRDISPQNILITRGGLVKLSDFGVARASIQMHKTKTGQVRGKAPYMAPEQVRAHSLDGRTDMFALALVLYEALTGSRPFHRRTDIASMRAVLGDKTTSIRELNPTVPKDLEQILAQCLQKAPERRFSNCKELEESLLACYQSIREPDIISKISEIMSDVFGEAAEGHIEGEEPSESWHPTIKMTAHGAIEQPIPQKLMEGEISGEIAKLLGGSDSVANSKSTDKQLSVTRFHSSTGKNTESLVSFTARPLGSVPHLSPKTSKNKVSLESMILTSSTNLSDIQTAKSNKKWLLLAGLGGFLALLTFAAFFLLPDNRIQKKQPSGVPDFSLRAVPGNAHQMPPGNKPQLDPVTTASKDKNNKKDAVSQEKQKTTRKRNKDKSKSTQKSKPIVNKKKSFTIEMVDSWLEIAKRKQQTKRVRELETILLKMMEGEPLSQKDRGFLSIIKRTSKAD
ncbi:MAG: serine/threonine-protein kinase [Myxococcota bacterium]|nr:serine/threonine-protein kinase [Myxococcota bacterium]